MSAENLRASIEHQSMDLRAAYPYIESCQSALVQWSEEGQARYSLGLDIRWPQRQTLLSGPAQATAEAAVEAAFRAARERLQRRPP